MSKKIFPKRNEKPNLDYLLSLFSNETMSAFINGHLIIEALLIQFIELKCGKNDAWFKLNFPGKLDKCVSLGFFNDKLSGYLSHINDIRNNYAHNLGYDVTFDELFVLAQLAGSAGIDFSDETIYQNRKVSEEWYGREGIIQEVFQNTAMDLSFIIESHGGKFEFS